MPRALAEDLLNQLGIDGSERASWWSREQALWADVVHSSFAMARDDRVPVQLANGRSEERSFWLDQWRARWIDLRNASDQYWRHTMIWLASVVKQIPPDVQRRVREQWLTERYACPICLNPVRDLSSIALDHKWPRFRGGAAVVGNLRVAHASRNSSRSKDDQNPWLSLDTAADVRRRSAEQPWPCAICGVTSDVETVIGRQHIYLCDNHRDRADLEGVLLTMPFQRLRPQDAFGEYWNTSGPQADSDLDF